MSSGSGDNTLVEVKIVTVLYPNGDVLSAQDSN